MVKSKRRIKVKGLDLLTSIVVTEQHIPAIA